MMELLNKADCPPFVWNVVAVMNHKYIEIYYNAGSETRGELQSNKRATIISYGRNAGNAIAKIKLPSIKPVS
jgi:hypothetical protein